MKNIHENLKSGKSMMRYIIFLMCVILLFASGSVAKTHAYSDVADLQVAIHNVDQDAIEQHVRFLADRGSRISGYDGFFQAANYIASKFSEFGISPYGLDEGYFEYYNITVPMDLGATVSLPNGSSIEAYLLWPNYVNPSPYESPAGGDSLIYVGDGSLGEYSGKNITGKFVLMNFDSRWYFRYAATFGAKGVIYLPSSEVTRIESLQKLYSVPLNFPRMYVPSYEDGQKLLSAARAPTDVRIRINARIEWREIQIPNVVGYVKGSDSESDQAIIISAYYDSWSIVPKSSPGATHALGISVLLDLARFLSQSPAKRSVIFLALSGHWEGLWGAREYVDRHFGELGSKIKAFISMDLASDSDQIGIYSIGSTYAYLYPESLNARYSQIVNLFFQNYLPKMKEVLGVDFGDNFVDRILLTHPNYIQGNYPMDFSGTFAFDSEPYTLACYGGGFTYHTTNAIRLFAMGPTDTYNRIIFSNLWPQVRFIFASLWGLLNEPEIFLPQNPARFGPSDWGYSTVTIQVSTYNMTTAYWDPFDAEHHPQFWRESVVHFASSTLIRAYGASYGAGSGVPYGGSGLPGALDLTLIPNEDGVVTVKGVKPLSTGYVDAYVLNRTDGRILWATDLGAYQAPPGGREIQISSANYRRLISIFPFANIALFSVLDPSSLLLASRVDVFNYIAHGPQIHQSSLYTYYADLMVFVEPDTPTELIVTVPGIPRPVSVLNNASTNNADGSGYKVHAGETLRIALTPFELLNNLDIITIGRLQKAMKYNAYNPSIILYHDLAEQYRALAAEMIASNKPDLAYAYSFSGWSYAQKMYNSLMDLINEVIDTTVFVFILLIVFSVCFERLLFGAHNASGLKRLTRFFAIFVVFLTILGIVHPGFQLAANIIMVLLAFAGAIIIVPIVGFIISEAAANVREMRSRILGKHSLEISRIGALVYAASQGIENSRKRGFHTTLSIISISLVILAMVTFTSIATMQTPRAEKYAVKPLYEGILLRKFPWAAIPEEMYHQIEAEFRARAIIAPRTWMFPAAAPGRGTAPFWCFTPRLTTQIKGALFLAPEEANVSHVDSAIIAGRWFTEDDLYAVIVSEAVAKSLTVELARNVTVGSRINFLGLELAVVGIIDGNSLWSGEKGFIDLDGEPITPVSLTGGAAEKPPHIVGDFTLIMPYRLALAIKENNWPFSLAIKPYDPDTIPRTATELALRTSTDVLYGMTPRNGDGEIDIVRFREWFTATGVTVLAMPLVISSLTILNMMIASIYQRSKEIRTLMSIGLNPYHIIGILLVETVMVALIGSTIGYIGGVSSSFLMSNYGLYPKEFYPNYASRFVLITLVSAISMALVSSLYPAYKAARVVNPSLQMKWRMPTPIGDKWIIPLPFVAASREETLGILKFIREYLSFYGGERSGLFEAQEIETEEGIIEGKELYYLKMKVRLAPFDVGILQDTVIESFLAEKSRYTFRIRIEKISGLNDPWVNSNKLFVANLRKQFMLWRALPKDEKTNYMAEVAEGDASSRD